MVDFINIDGLSELEWAFLADIYDAEKKGKKLGAISCEFGTSVRKALMDLQFKGLVTLINEGDQHYSTTITEAGKEKYEKMRG